MDMFNQIADLCDEAAKNLAALMETAEADRLQVRHFLPDELHGSALMLRDPIDMVLHCPKCGVQHIDAPEVRRRPDNSGADNWTNPPHRSHLCCGCGHIWRPADVPTNGVRAVKTRGKNDSPL